jgi:outer membrane protein assembly factor BamD
MLNFSFGRCNSVFTCIFAAMLKMKSLILVTLGILTLIGCGEYNTIVKSDDYDAKLAKAESLYESKSFNRALVLYEQVYQRYPRDGRGEIAYFRLAKSYYAIEDYYMAGYYFGNFVNRFPISPKAEESLFMSAMCSVKNAPAEPLDQEETEIALNELQLFVQRYPDSELIDSCNQVMDKLRLKLENKAFLSVKLYAQTEKYQAAVVSGRSFIEEYPQSNNREEVAFIMLQNGYILASKSIFSRKKERLEEVLSIYESYKSDLEKRRYQSRALDYYKNTQVMLAKVDEEVEYQGILSAYASSQSLSTKKKIDFLKETIERYHKFANKYPESTFLKKAEDTFNKADKELNNFK